jgi:hypothetical protein
MKRNDRIQGGSNVNRGGESPLHPSGISAQKHKEVYYGRDYNH